MKPVVKTGCPANRHTSADERIIEFAFPGCPRARVRGDLPGGLIAFRNTGTADDPRPTVEVYRTEGQVRVVSDDRAPDAVPTRRTFYRVTTSIAGVDEESREYFATEDEARTEVYNWRGQIGDDTGDAWDVYAEPVYLDLPAFIPDAIVLALLNEGGITAGATIASCRCRDCDGEILDEERNNAFAVDAAPLTTQCLDCAPADEDEDDSDDN